MLVNQVKWNIGSHMSFRGRICDTLWTSVNRGMYTVQFFIGNHISLNRSSISENDIIQCKKILSMYPMSVFSHFPYVSNLCNKARAPYIIKSLEYELSILGNFDNSGVVIHPGNHIDTNIGLETIANTINSINFTPNSKLILENCAGQGNSLCRNLKEFKKIYSCLNSTSKKHVGICIDTCHLFAVGDYDIRINSEIDRLFDDFDRLIGLEYFSLLHLNDSERDIASKRDRHIYLGGGYIWKDNFSALVYLLDKCDEHKIPMVLETTPFDMYTLGDLS